MRMRRSKWAVASALAGAMTVAPMLSAAAVPADWAVDQENRPADEESSTYSYCPRSDPDFRLVQEIAATASAWVGATLVLVYQPDMVGTEVPINVRSGSATSPIVGSATAALPPNDSPGTLIVIEPVDFAFGTPVPVAAGVVYLELPQDVLRTEDGPPRLGWAMTESDAYPVGDAMATCAPGVDPLPNPPFGEDFIFTTYTTGPVDRDRDGVPDTDDAFPDDPTEWSDRDGDGVGDNTDVFPDDPTEWADSDGDGLGDNGDPDTAAAAVAALPDDTFKGRGHRTAITAQLDSAEADIMAGDTASARTTLENLRRHLDGCETGTTADTDDWIVDCAAQDEIRALIDTLLATLS